MFLVWFNATFLAFWTAMMPVTLYTVLKSSVPYVAAISVWALIAAHLTGLIAAIVAVQQWKIEHALDEHRQHNRIFHRRVSTKLGIDPPEVPAA